MHQTLHHKRSYIKELKQVSTPQVPLTCLSMFSFIFPFDLCNWELNLTLQPAQIVSGCLQQCVTPLLPLKRMLGHFWWRWLWRAFPSENFLQTHCKHVDVVDGFPELPMKGNIFGIQVLLLILQDILQALSHKKEATLNFWPLERRALLDLELREAWGPSAKVLPIGFILKDKTNTEFNWKICSFNMKYQISVI